MVVVVLIVLPVVMISLFVSEISWSCSHQIMSKHSSIYYHIGLVPYQSHIIMICIGPSPQAEQPFVQVKVGQGVSMHRDACQAEVLFAWQSYHGGCHCCETEVAVLANFWGSVQSFWRVVCLKTKSKPKHQTPVNHLYLIWPGVCTTILEVALQFGSGH